MMVRLIKTESKSLQKEAHVRKPDAIIDTNTHFHNAAVADQLGIPAEDLLWEIEPNGYSVNPDYKDYIFKDKHDNSYNVRVMGPRPRKSPKKESVKTKNQKGVNDMVTKLNEEFYGVFRKGGSIGDSCKDKLCVHQGRDRGELVKVFDDPDEAKDYAKSMRSQLSKGERSYYGMGYFTKKLSDKDLEHPQVKSLLGESLTEVLSPDDMWTKQSVDCYCEKLGIGRKDLTSIVIPEGIISIWEQAFRGCTSLKSITIPDSVSDIGIDVFDGCRNLTIKCHKDSYAHEYAERRGIPVNLIESFSESRISSSETKDYRMNESLTEAAGQDYEVKQVSFDVAVPAGTDLNCQAMSGNREFYKAVSDMLASLGYEMAGDMIDSHDMTQIYKDNDYEFFTESASLKEGTDSLRSKFLRIMKEIDEETPMDQESADRFWDKWYSVIEPLFDYSDEEGPDDSYYKYYSQVEVPDEVMKQVIDIYSKEFRSFK